MIASLQSWRFIFALMIFFHHLDGLFMQGGACGVSFFMVLSGFVMSLGYYDKVQRSEFSFRIFIQKRLFRLYPLHLLCMVGVVLLHCKSLSLGFLATLVPQAVLLHSWIPYQEIYFAGNALSWCLADMIFFYLMFPYIVRYIEHHTRKVLVFMVVVMLGVYALLLVFLPETWCHPVLYINPLLRLYDFVLGVCLYRLYLRLEVLDWGSGWSYLQKSGLEMLAVGLLVSCILIHPSLPARYTLACYYWLPISLIILLFAQFNISGGGNFRPFKMEMDGAYGWSQF